VAAGDIVFFEEFVRTLGEEKHDFSSDTIKVGLVTNGVTPTAGDTTPTWSDYSGSEVSTAGGYTSGGETLTTVTWTEAGGVATLDADSIALAQNGSGFTNAYWAIIYNDSSADDDAIAFVDLGGPVSEQAGAVNINWDPGGIIGTEQGHGTTWTIEQNAVVAELVTIGYTSGVPNVDTSSGAVPGGGGTHLSNRSGSYEIGSGSNSLAEANDWSGSSYGAYLTNKSHRIGGTSGTDAVTMAITPNTAISLGASDVLYCEMLCDTMPTSTGLYQIFMFNSSQHWIRLLLTDTGGSVNYKLEYNNGSTTYSGTSNTPAALPSGVNQIRGTFNGSDGSEAAFSASYNGTSISSLQYPTEWPGWSTFGSITTILHTMVMSGGTTGYIYGARVNLNGGFG